MLCDYLFFSSLLLFIFSSFLCQNNSQPKENNKKNKKKNAEKTLTRIGFSVHSTGEDASYSSFLEYKNKIKVKIKEDVKSVKHFGNFIVRSLFLAFV